MQMSLTVTNMKRGRRQHFFDTQGSTPMHPDEREKLGKTHHDLLGSGGGQANGPDIVEMPLHQLLSIASVPASSAPVPVLIISGDMIKARDHLT